MAVTEEMRPMLMTETMLLKAATRPLLLEKMRETMKEDEMAMACC
jgi:hypothetical protein